MTAVGFGSIRSACWASKLASQCAATRKIKGLLSDKPELWVVHPPLIRWSMKRCGPSMMLLVTMGVGGRALA
jgi:hypothetical protein